jgi:DNA polymerase epsilon subunit 2
MIVLVEGIYSENYSHTAESALGNTGGIGGTIGGKFISSLLAHPPCERRSASLGIKDSSISNDLSGPAFGWNDFLGVGSERATGTRMRRLEQQVLGLGAPYAGNSKIAIAAEINLDNPSTLMALRTLLSTYAALPKSEFPMSIVLMGNFLSQPALSGSTGTSSIDYKDSLNCLASTLSDFPQLIARTTLIFVPGENDVWASSFASGASAPIPRKPLPEIFMNRIRRVIAEANREAGGLGKRKEGEVVWTTNPSRVSWFGCRGEMVLFRDDVLGRLRRTALSFNKPEEAEAEQEAQSADDEHGDEFVMSGANPDAASSPQPAAVSSEIQDEMEVDSSNPLPPQRQSNLVDQDALTTRRLTRTLLDQAHLSPFPLDKRPVHWDYGHVLSLYPLPSAMVIADAEAPPFSLNYNGCAVMNPGRLVEGRRGERARWVEFDVWTGKGAVRVEDG